MLARTLDDATGTLLENGKSPSRKVGELDNRGSHYHLARYWAEALAAQTEHAELAAAFAPLAERLAADEDAILAELGDVQGGPVDLGGYYFAGPGEGDRRDATERDVQRRARFAGHRPEPIVTTPARGRASRDRS